MANFYPGDGSPPLALAFYHGGNVLSQALTLGTYDSYSLTIMTANTAAISIDTSQNVAIAGTLTPTGVLKIADGAVGAPGLSFASDTDCGLYHIAANDIGIAVGGALAFEIKGLDVVCGNAAIATNATSGFFWHPACAGAATGTPANTFTGRVPMVFDSTNGRLYAYYGGAWKYAAVAT